MYFDIALPPGTALPEEAPVTYPQMLQLLPLAKKALALKQRFGGS